MKNLIFVFIVLFVGDLQSQTSPVSSRSYCGGILNPTDYHYFKQQSHPSSTIFMARSDPIAVRKNVDEFRLLLGIQDSNVVSVEFESVSFGLLFDVLYQGQVIRTLRPYDDGTHGDEIAGDRIFAIDQLTLRAKYASIDPIFSFLIVAEANLGYATGAPAAHSEFFEITIHYYDPSVVSVPHITRLADDVQMTEHVVNITAPVAGVFPQQSVDHKKIAKRYYDFFTDDRDMLIMAQPFSNASIAAGIFMPVRNAVTGIGMPTIDESAEYASAGRLQGVIHVFQGNTFPWLLTHEILHRWAVSPNISLDLGTPTGDWEAIQRSTTGFGEGGPYNGVYSKLAHLSANQYSASAENISAYYSDIEMYLMGLIPASEVESPIMTLVNPQVVDWQNFIYEADGLRAVEINEIIKLHGPRVPDHLESQKHFTSATIVIYDRLLSDVELAYYDFLSREYEKPATEYLSGMSDGLTFEAATNGRATWETRLSEPMTGIEAKRQRLLNFRLSQNYPNPFNPQTTITYELDQPEIVKLTIYNLLGQPVGVLVDEWQNAGTYKMIWPASVGNNSTTRTSGIYFYELQAGKRVERKKMTLLQ